MMDKVYSKEEAMSWFLSNSSGSVICVRSDGAERECFSFLEAEEFYDEE